MLSFMRPYNIIQILLFILLLSSIGVSQDISSRQRVSVALSGEQIIELEEVFRREVKSQELIGAAAAVIIDGKVGLLLAEGLSDSAAGDPVDAHKTLFRWASISKPLTAVAGLQLNEEGALDLDSDVRQLVPEFPDKGVVISPRQLMGHLAGIVHYHNGPVIRSPSDPEIPHPYADVIGALETFKESPLVNTPGEDFAYSTHGYILLSAVIQRAGGQKFADQVNERIAMPLGMTTLQPDYQWIEIPGRATGYRRQDSEIVESRDADVSWKLGGGGFISSVADLGAFAAGLLQGSLLQTKTQELAWTSMMISKDQNPNQSQLTHYGLGFGVRTHSGRRVVSHSGAQEKTRTYMLLYPDQMSGVVVMTNSEWGNPRAIATALASMIPSPRLPASSAAP
ncbi:MAG: beta-lactamase family protein [Phycisphaerales bacterium]|nr:beta-lactamase family protein [Phycisphaerales bacterium]